jgi:hypothetical protein
MKLFKQKNEAATGLSEMADEPIIGPTIPMKYSSG